MEHNSTEFSLFMNMLDAQSRRIIWYFRFHRYVRIAELTELIGAVSDMETLYRIKEIINPIATSFFSEPILEFHKYKIDQKTGKSILFNWWMSDIIEEDQTVSGEREKPLIDIFDEENRIVIISEMPASIKLSDVVNIEQQHGLLSITLNKMK